MITYAMQLFNAVNMAVHMGVAQTSRGVTVLPLFHVGGLCVYLSPLLHSGGSSLIMDQFEPEVMLRLMTDHSIGLTHMLGVPTNYMFVAQLPTFKDAQIDHLQSVGVGGAAPSISLLETYAAKGVLIEHAWGMTETSAVATTVPKEMALKKLGSCGLPVMHVETKVVNDDGNTLPPGEVGELLIRGLTVVREYWQLPDATAQSFLPGGWFKTGDAARMDEDGYYYIVDRWKDMYISGGENVYPAEVENALYCLNGVAECAVIGIPDDRWGEVGRAFIVAQDGAGLTEESVIAHCREQLAHYKAPKSVRSIEELPHNATGKVTKHILPRE